MRSSIEGRALLSVLQRCRELVTASEDSDWSCMDVADIVAMLGQAIRALEASSPVEINELRFLFVVTGPLQETSMSNGWAEEFLVLAARFDEIVGKSS